MARKTFDDTQKQFVLNLKKKDASNREIARRFSDKHFNVSYKLIGRRLDEWEYSIEEAPKEPDIENIDDSDPDNWWRKCPDCGKKIEYTRKYNWKNYRKTDVPCNDCVKKGDKNPFAGKEHNEEYKELMSKAQSDASFNGRKRENREIRECKHPDCENTYRVRVSLEQEFCSIGCYHKWVASYQNYYISKPERLFKKKLKESNAIDEFEHQFHLEGKFYDFRVGNTLIEVDGTWWHGKGKSIEELEEMRKEIRQNDLEKNDIAEQNDFEIVRIWTDEINDTEPKKLI